LIIGDEEMDTGLLTFKDMVSGEQEKLSIGDVKIRLGF
jgi:histidyl-tRNA synthetase